MNASESHSAALQIGQQPPVERADAARNRKKIIEAANRIVADKGFAALTLDDVAREAGLGIGTVYRRFGDRASLLYTLLGERAHAFQTAFMAGPPPLGPGAPTAERIREFLHAVVDYTAENAELLLEAEASSPTARQRSGPYQAEHMHLAMLLAQANPGADSQYLADALLAPLSATLIEYQRSERGATCERIKAGLDDLLSLALLVDKAPGRRGGPTR